MISTWSEWKRYPRAGRGENIEAPISPGIYEVRIAGDRRAALVRCGRQRRAGAGAAAGRLQIMVRTARARAPSPELEYRTCATSSKADAKAAAERMIGRRETYMSGAA